MARVTRKVCASEIMFLDPLGCDSTVGYHVVKRGKTGVSGTVDLSDCNRKITWYFGRRDSFPSKIDSAINILTNFKNEFMKAKKEV